MKISYNWLKEYLKTDLTAEQLSVMLTDIGLEVDGIEKIESIRGGLEGVVVAEVLTKEKHPDADKLSVTTLSTGTGEPLQVVCGAPNVAAGQKVLLATINTTLYPKGEEEGFKIKRSKIRGIESLGMICAADELGIGEDHSGIMVLDAAAVAGTPAKDYLDLKDDYLIEIGLTPNRADAASHYGVARDLAAKLAADGIECSLKLPSVESYKTDNTSCEIKVSVENHDAAPRYAGVTISDVKIAPSPEWLQTYLRTIGINPKNNVVDITNFVLHEVGQPLHAFDAANIEGGKIVVRNCPEGTPFVTLDGVERKLSANDLMICNAKEPMCIAGVFGGLDSGVTESTKAVFLESAYFNPVSVRKTARRHGLNTDSSFRFERGIDPDITIYALKRAALLIKEYAGGVITSEITDIYPQPIEPFRFEISLERINKLIGKHIPAQTIRQILSALDVRVEKDGGDLLSVAVPPYRVDVQREADLTEDILRIYGYNNIEIPHSVHSSLSYAPKPDVPKLINMVSDALTAKGFTEIMSNSLTKAAYYENLKSYPAENCVRILNPLSNDLNVLRQTLLFNAMEAVELNSNRRNNNLKMYEFGNCYRVDTTKPEDAGLAKYPETYRMAVTITGDDNAPSWNVTAGKTSFFTLRAEAEQLLRRFGLDIYHLRSEPIDSDLFDEGLRISAGNKELIQLGSVAARIRSVFDLKAPVYFMEVNFDTLVSITRKHKVQAEELSKYPEVKRDLALLVDKEVTFAELRRIAFATEKKLLREVSLFDVYEGDKLPEGKKSYALSFMLEDKNRTLTDNDIDRSMKNLVTQFEKQAGAAIRA